MLSILKLLKAGISKLPPVPARPPQKVKATLANIPVGCFDGGGRGKEREKDKEKEKERDREKEKESGGLFLEMEKGVEPVSALPVTLEESSSEAESHSVAETGTSNTCSKEPGLKEVSRNQHESERVKTVPHWILRCCSSLAGTGLVIQRLLVSTIVRVSLLDHIK